MTKTTSQRRRTSTATRAPERAGIQLAPETVEAPRPTAPRPRRLRGISAESDGYSYQTTQVETMDWRTDERRGATFEFDMMTSNDIQAASIGWGTLQVKFYGFAPGVSAEDVPVTAKIDCEQIRAEDVEVLAAGFATLAQQMKRDGVFATIARQQRSAAR